MTEATVTDKSVNPTPLADRHILRIKDVERKIGLKKAWIYILINKGQFPKQLRLGPRSVGWISFEIDQWIEEHMQRR
ncbi:MAG: AlpA family transcriptional regulator [Saezia sp.]